MKLHESWQLKADEVYPPEERDFQGRKIISISNVEIRQPAYIKGAQNCLDAVEATITNMLQDLYTPEEKQAIKDVLTKLQTLKPL